MDSSIGPGTDELFKNWLKTLPIWSYHDKFKAELEVTQHKLNNYIKGLNEREDRLVNLLRFSDKQAKDRAVSNDLDIVRLYRKINGSYQIHDQEREAERQKKASRDAFRTESVYLLEEKVKHKEEVYAMLKPGKPWVKCKIVCIFRKLPKNLTSHVTTTLRLELAEGSHAQVYYVDKFSIARIQDHKDNLKAAKRVIAGLTPSTLLPGIIGEQPDASNKNRYLVFMDNGSAKYFSPHQVYPILGQSPIPWLDARKLGTKNQENEGHLRHYFSTYPKKHILKAKRHDKIELFRNGSIVTAEILDIDCNTIRLHYKDNTEETIYRGSPRLLKKTNMISKLLANVKNLDHFHDILLLYMHLYSEASSRALDEDILHCAESFEKNLTMGKNTARKSTAKRAPGPKRYKIALDGQPVQEDRNTIDDLPEDTESRSHRCSVQCLTVHGVRTETSVGDIVNDYRDVSDLKVPLLLGWKRKLQRISEKTGKKKIKITYEAPCGRVYLQLHHIRGYLQRTGSILDVDYFSFDRDISLNQEIGEFEAYVHQPNIAVDRETGAPLENKNISLLNQCSEERLPDDFEYRNVSFPHKMLEKRGFSFNSEFKSGCDCEDDCSHRSTCACHKLNEIFYGSGCFDKGTVDYRCQYNHKRLTGQVQTGIFECNAFCKCSSKCSNRVVQNGIRYRLQVTRTLNKGWGVITLDDIPSGAFICTYSAEVLDDADNYGDSDMYYADLDYITENERLKQVNSEDEKSDEGVDTDDEPVIEKKKNSKQPSIVESDEESSSSSIEVVESRGKYFPQGDSAPRYPKRKVKQTARQGSETPANQPKFRRIHKLLNSRDFTLDARMQGNIGRFFNHSCDPNTFVQNVFIDTHDLRFPVVAFFAMRTIKALSEINWNYSYKVGTIPGRRIDCHCGASNCQGRIL